MTDQISIWDHIEATKRRELALDRHEYGSSRDYVLAARDVARNLALTHEHVHVDMIREILPPPSWMEPRALGSVLRAPEWKKVGEINSGRKECHARPIGLFKWVKQG